MSLLVERDVEVDGRSLGEADRGGMVKCPDCGMLNAPGRSKCKSCGDSLKNVKAKSKLTEAAVPSKPGTNWTQVGPAARKKVDPLVRHWMSKAHPWQACVDELGPEKGMEAAKRICSVVKDMGMKTTKWRKGGKGRSKVSEGDAAVAYVVECVEEAAARVEELSELLGVEQLQRIAESAHTGDTLIDRVQEMAFADMCLLDWVGYPLAEALTSRERWKRWEETHGSAIKALKSGESHSIPGGVTVKRERPTPSKPHPRYTVKGGGHMEASRGDTAPAAEVGQPEKAAKLASLRSLRSRDPASLGGTTRYRDRADFEQHGDSGGAPKGEANIAARRRAGLSAPSNLDRDLARRGGRRPGGLTGGKATRHRRNRRKGGMKQSSLTRELTGLENGLVEAVLAVATAPSPAWAPQLVQGTPSSSEDERIEVWNGGQLVGYVVKRERYSRQDLQWQARTLNGDSAGGVQNGQQDAVAALRKHLETAERRIVPFGGKWLVMNPSSYGKTTYTEYASSEAAREAVGLPPKTVAPVAQESRAEVAPGLPFDLAEMGTGERVARGITRQPKTSTGVPHGKYTESKHKRGAKGTSQGGKFISSGASGSDVKAVQKAVGAKPDGAFGYNTRASVMAFQRRHGLKVDGVVGHQTAAAISGQKNAAKVKTGALTKSDRTALRGKQRSKRLSRQNTRRATRRARAKSGLAPRAGGGILIAGDVVFTPGDPELSEEIGVHAYTRRGRRGLVRVHKYDRSGDPARRGLLGRGGGASAPTPGAISGSKPGEEQRGLKGPGRQPGGRAPAGSAAGRGKPYGGAGQIRAGRAGRRPPEGAPSSQLLAFDPPADTQKRLATMFTPQEHAAEKLHQPTSNGDELYKRSAATLEDFKRLLNMGKGVSQRLGAKTSGIDGPSKDPRSAHVVIAPLKGRKRADEKVIGKYGGDYSKLADVVRGTVTVPSMDELPAAVVAIRTEAKAQGWKIHAPETRFVHEEGSHVNTGELASGYRDVSMQLVSPEGIVAELQVNTSPMFVAKEGDGSGGVGHKLYEEERAITEGAQAAGRPLTQQERNRVEALRTKARALYSQAHADSFSAAASRRARASGRRRRRNGRG